MTDPNEGAKCPNCYVSWGGGHGWLHAPGCTLAQPATGPDASEWVGNPDYKPLCMEQALAYLVEEAGEMLAAAGKSQRWGLESTNPELPMIERETNQDWLLREMKDVERAIAMLRERLHAREGDDE